MIHLNKTKREKERMETGIRSAPLIAAKGTTRIFFFSRNDIFFIFVPSQINPHIPAKNLDDVFAYPSFLQDVWIPCCIFINKNGVWGTLRRRKSRVIFIRATREPAARPRMCVRI